MILPISAKITSFLFQPASAVATISGPSSGFEGVSLGNASSASLLPWAAADVAVPYETGQQPADWILGNLRFSGQPSAPSAARANATPLISGGTTAAFILPSLAALVVPAGHDSFRSRPGPAWACSTPATWPVAAATQVELTEQALLECAMAAWGAGPIDVDEDQATLLWRTGGDTKMAAVGPTDASSELDDCDFPTAWFQGL